jgi:hypothetical protein
VRGGGLPTATNEQRGRRERGEREGTDGNKNSLEHTIWVVGFS